MKRLVLRSFGDPRRSVALEEFDAGAPAGDQVLVRMEAAVLNHSDFLLIQGRHALRPELPSALGAEGLGRVIAVGAGVDQHLVGRRVIVLPTYEQGSWAEEIITARRNLVVVDDDADSLQLAMLPINPPTAELLLRRHVDLKVGDWIGQTAANSAVGRYVIALARERGLKTLNVVRRQTAADMVHSAGGDAVMLAGEDLPDQIANALGGERLALVIDPLNDSSLSALSHALRFGGVAVSYADLSGEPPLVSVADLIFNEVTLTGFWLTNWLRTAPSDEIASTYATLAAMVSDGRLRVPVEATYCLDDYTAAFDHALAHSRQGKILFTF